MHTAFRRSRNLSNIGLGADSLGIIKLGSNELSVVRLNILVGHCLHRAKSYY